MKLWKITQNSNRRAIAVRAAVVVAATEDDARATTPVPPAFVEDAWAPPEQVRAEYLGEAATGRAADVVLTSPYVQ